MIDIFPMFIYNIKTIIHRRILKRKRPKFLAKKVLVQNSVQTDNTKTSKVRVTVLCTGIRSVNGLFPAEINEETVTRKVLPFDDVKMFLSLVTLWLISTGKACQLDGADLFRHARSSCQESIRSAPRSSATTRMFSSSGLRIVSVWPSGARTSAGVAIA